MDENSSQVGDGQGCGQVLVLLPARPSQTGAIPLWPKHLRCDVVDAPMEVCCGVFAHLSRADLPASPTAYVADRFLFLVSEGSTAIHLDGTEGLPAGILLHESIESFPAYLDGCSLPANCWVLPPDDRAELPHACAVLTALRSAYLEYGNAKRAS